MKKINILAKLEEDVFEQDIDVINYILQIVYKTIEDD